jgi:hypothetical protein
MTDTNVKEIDTQLKILSRLESMEDNQADIYNVIDSVWNELISIHDTIKLYTAGRGLTGISKLEGKLIKNRRYYEEKAFDIGIKDGSIKPLGICIIPDNFTNHKKIYNSEYLDLFIKQYPHLCPSEGWYSGTWTIKPDIMSKIALYYHLPTHNESKSTDNVK